MLLSQIYLFFPSVWSPLFTNLCNSKMILTKKLKIFMMKQNYTILMKKACNGYHELPRFIPYWYC